MANFKKISDSTFDLNRSIIIAGKGPSISNVEGFLKDKNPDDFYFCAVNTAYMCLPRVDFLSFCDLGVVEKLDGNNRKDYKKIKNLICPLVLREDSPSGAFETDKTYKWLFERLERVDVNIYNYRLHTQVMKLQKDENVDDFCIHRAGDGGPIGSSYQCGLSWLTRAGFKVFHVFGVSKRREYGKVFVKSNDCGNKRADRWYKKNFLRGKSILKQNKCSYKFY